MPTDVLIPKLGMTMTEGTVAEWLVPDGAPVRAGDIVYRLETEKIEFQVEAEADGILRHAVPAGTTLPPGAVVGWILAPGEAPPAGAPAAPPGDAAAAGAGPVPPPPPAEGRLPASPAARRLAAELGVPLEAVLGTGPGGRITEEDVRRAHTALGATAAAPAQSAEPPAATPVARALARELGVDLAAVRGTGPGGRITKEDVEAAAARPAPAAPSPAPAAPAPAAGERIPLRGMRRTIADRMHRSLQEMAQLTLGMRVRMDEALRLREQLIAEWQPEGIRPSITDLVIRAAAKALRRHPALNARVEADAIVLEPAVHIGMAVALDAGLVVPVIRGADALSLRDLARETSHLAEAARAGTLGLDDYAGQTFSVTSLGMAGVEFFTPIINPPNVAILGIGRVVDDIAWEGDRPVRARSLTLSLTIDHRAVDGAPGAAFLAEVRDLLESPYRLLV
ncbi:dihydrolipoamide acetyltransferase family protein [Tepidiforma flava]|uniref:Dihydrolipoamide acetyltransferase component of pyruvate dehydrogenase complex n=1 Tax=Tepidiforma flava TaxID=3004094 RepID=A0ABY7M9B4_9CHLR|nr:dihydrolipoamide acetyltransferase family protein [Tepidiforma flava]WBL37109.1 dihydrolipoamide acetyltransferase family protein [Tepidiforma flava]